jgi:Ca-activated chloride channel family protein
MNLALVLDRSGSMMGEPLDCAKNAASLLLRRVWPEDAVSVVVYDHEVGTLIAQATDTNHQRAAELIRDVDARGMTNLSGGWLRGRDLTEEGLLDGGVNRVILLTDGCANQGITDPHLLTEMCREAAAKGITTTTIGFGPHYDEDLLRAMADAGRGSAYYVERADQTSGIFEEEVEGLLSLVAQNVTAEVTPGSGSELAFVQHSYPRAPLGRGVRLELGDLYAREPRRVLLNFRLPSATPGEVLEVGHVRVEGHVVSAGGGVQRRAIDLPIRFTLEAGARVDPEVTKVALLLEAAHAREEAVTRRDRGDWQGAHDALLSARASMLSLGGDDADVVREARDLSMSAAAFADQSLSDADIKYLKQQAYNESRSRGSGKERIRRG